MNLVKCYFLDGVRAVDGVTAVLNDLPGRDLENDIMVSYDAVAQSNVSAMWGTLNANGNVGTYSSFNVEKWGVNGTNVYSYPDYTPEFDVACKRCMAHKAGSSQYCKFTVHDYPTCGFQEIPPGAFVDVTDFQRSHTVVDAVLDQAIVDGYYIPTLSVTTEYSNPSGTMFVLFSDEQYLHIDPGSYVQSASIPTCTQKYGVDDGGKCDVDLKMITPFPDQFVPVTAYCDSVLYSCDMSFVVNSTGQGVLPINLKGSTKEISVRIEVGDHSFSAVCDHVTAIDARVISQVSKTSPGQMSPDRDGDPGESWWTKQPKWTKGLIIISCIAGFCIIVSMFVCLHRRVKAHNLEAEKGLSQVHVSGSVPKGISIGQLRCRLASVIMTIIVFWVLVGLACAYLLHAFDVQPGLVQVVEGESVCFYKLVSRLAIGVSEALSGDCEVIRDRCNRDNSCLGYQKVFFSNLTCQMVMYGSKRREAFMGQGFDKVCSGGVNVQPFFAILFACLLAHVWGRKFGLTGDQYPKYASDFFVHSQEFRGTGRARRGPKRGSGKRGGGPGRPQRQVHVVQPHVMSAAEVTISGKNEVDSYKNLIVFDPSKVRGPAEKQLQDYVDTKIKEHMNSLGTQSWKCLESALDRVLMYVGMRLPPIKDLVKKQEGTVRMSSHKTNHVSTGKGEMGLQHTVKFQFNTSLETGRELLDHNDKLIGDHHYGKAQTNKYELHGHENDLTLSMAQYIKDNSLKSVNAISAFINDYKDGLMTQDPKTGDLSYAKSKMLRKQNTQQRVMSEGTPNGSRRESMTKSSWAADTEELPDDVAQRLHEEYNLQHVPLAGDSAHENSLQTSSNGSNPQLNLGESSTGGGDY